jgi:hypothetical protein
MPEFVNSSVGSFFSTRGAEGTMVWPLLAKKSKNFRLIEPESILIKHFKKLKAEVKSLKLVYNIALGVLT